MAVTDTENTDTENLSSDEETNSATGVKLDGGLDGTAPAVSTPVVRGSTAGSASQNQTNRKRESKKAANSRATLNWMHRDPNAPNIDAVNYEVNRVITVFALMM